MRKRSRVCPAFLLLVLVSSSCLVIKASDQNGVRSDRLRSNVHRDLKADSFSIAVNNPQSEIESVDGVVSIYSPNVFHDEIQMKKNVENAKISNLTAIVHIGPEKTGSSTLQLVLDQFLLPDFEQDGYVRISNGGRRNSKQFGACFNPRPSLKVDFPKVCSYDDLMNPISIATDERKNILVTAETLSIPGLDVAAMKNYLDQYWSNTIIVGYYRRFFSWIISLHNQINKGKSHTLEWLTAYLDHTRVEKQYDWNYIVGAIHRFKEEYNDNNIDVRNLHDLKDNLLVDFYCYAIPDSLRTCDGAQELVKSDSVPYVNEGVALVYNDLVYYAHELGLVSHDADFKTLQHLARERQEIELQLHDKDFDEFAIVCPKEEDYNTLLRLSLKAEEELFPDFHEERGRDEILIQFEQYKQARKFCHVDAKLLLEQGDSNHWNEYFVSLNM